MFLIDPKPIIQGFWQKIKQARFLAGTGEVWYHRKWKSVNQRKKQGGEYEQGKMGYPGNR